MGSGKQEERKPFLGDVGWSYSEALGFVPAALANAFSGARGAEPPAL